MSNSSARDTAYQIIREKIIQLDLKPGTVLSDKELAEEMNISRTPVREAMIMLNIADLVVVRPQSGTFVAPIDLEIVEMEQFTRCSLEKEMIRRACTLMTPENKSLYEENLHLYKFYQQSTIAGKAEKLHQLDNDFHRISFLINGKGQYFDKVQSTMHHVERLRILSMRSINDDRICQDHYNIAQSIMAKDAETAGNYLENHMNLYLEHLTGLRYKLPEYFKEAVAMV